MKHYLAAPAVQVLPAGKPEKRRNPGDAAEAVDRSGVFANHASTGDIEDAFTLYRQNIDIASSIQAITAMVEVVSRNAIDCALTGYVAHTGQVDDWFDLPVLDVKAQDDIRIARQRVRRSGNRVDHPHLVE